MFPNPLARNRRALFKTRIVALIFLCAAVGGTQEPSSGAGKATAKGTCAVSHVGNYDTITIQNCGIGEEQGKKIEDLLNRILKNQDLADANAKLDQLLAIVANLGPPKILFSKLPWQVPSSSGHPRVSIEFYTDRPDDAGQFGVLCDRACNPVDICVLQGQNSGAIGHMVGDLQTAVFLFRRQFPALMRCTLTVESADDKPVSITGMKHVLITDGRNFILGPVQPSHCLVGQGSVMC
jgi:hypothetical protein